MLFEKTESTAMGYIKYPEGIKSSSPALTLDYGIPPESGEVGILHAALGVILKADEQVSPCRVAEMAMVAAAFPAAVTEFQQHFAVWLRFEDEFLRRADPIRRAGPRCISIARARAASIVRCASEKRS